MPDLESKPDLIFHWFVKERRGWKLLVALMAVTLFLSGFLLLFQVVYPAIKHQRLAPQRVLMLDLSSPAARQVVDSISDRDFLVLRESTGVITPAGAKAPVFVPSFKGFEFRMRDFLETTSAAAPLPRIFQPDDAPLPPLPTVAAPVRNAEAVPQRLQAVLESGLKNRSLIKTVTIGEADAEGLKVYVAVASNGRVTSAVPVAPSPVQMTLFAKLRSTLDSLRFSPEAEVPVEWGTLTFAWKKEVAK